MLNLYGKNVNLYDKNNQSVTCRDINDLKMCTLAGQEYLGLQLKFLQALFMHKPNLLFYKLTIFLFKLFLI